MRISSFLLALTMMLAPLSLSAADVMINAVEIRGYGLFDATSERRAAYTGNRVGSDDVRNIKFTEFTEKVPGILKTNFGLQYVINTTPKGGQIGVTQVIRFPEGGIRQTSGRVYKKSEEKKKIRIGEPTLHGFGFDEKWEIVPGEWVFEVWHKNAMLLRKSFFVSLPEVARENSEN